MDPARRAAIETFRVYEAQYAGRPENPWRTRVSVTRMRNSRTAIGAWLVFTHQMPRVEAKTMPSCQARPPRRLRRAAASEVSPPSPGSRVQMFAAAVVALPGRSQPEERRDDRQIVQAARRIHAALDRRLTSNEPSEYAAPLRPDAV